MMKKIVLNEQNFTLLREKGGVYVDKTEQIYKSMDYSSYVFLSRPRRFGKSLLVSTLEALFLGKKELFKGLWIENHWKWEEYPVIRFDFSKLLTDRDLETIDDSLNTILKEYADKYEVEAKGKAPSVLFNSLLGKLYEKTGKKIVILIDEYDNPITSHLSDIKKAERNQEYFRNFYWVIKGNSGILEFVFITGVSKFAKLALFSAISQLKDISLLPPFNDIVGFTEEELKANFSEHIKAFGKARGIAEQDLMVYIKKWYDGYTWDGVQHLYNPYAILNALADQTIDTYWFETGTPTFLIRLLTHNQTFRTTKLPILQQLDELPASKETFDSYDLENINITAALFQSGYLTIKKRATRNGITNYRLGFPNYEVRHAFNAHLLKAITKVDIAYDIKARSIAFLEALEECDKDQFQQLLISIFSGIPSPNLKKIDEFGYQAMFYQLLLLLGISDIFLEVSGYIGRADGVLLLDNKVFIFELKFSRKGTMKYLLDKAADQAKLKGYWHPYLGTDKEIYRVAVGFLYKEIGEEKKGKLTIDSHWKKISSKEDYPE